MPNSNRTKYPGAVFVVLLIGIGFLFWGGIIRRSDTALLLALTPSGLACIFSALYYGERTFSPARADRRAESVTQHQRTFLRKAANVLFFLYVAAFILSLTFFIRNAPHPSAPMLIGNAFLIAAQTLREFLAEPVSPDSAGIEPLKL